MGRVIRTETMVLLHNQRLATMLNGRGFRGDDVMRDQGSLHGRSIDVVLSALLVSEWRTPAPELALIAGSDHQ